MRHTDISITNEPRNFLDVWYAANANNIIKSGNLEASTATIYIELIQEMHGKELNTKQFNYAYNRYRDIPNDIYLQSLKLSEDKRKVFIRCALRNVYKKLVARAVAV